MSDKNSHPNVYAKCDPVIRLPMVCEITGCSRGFIYEKMKEGTFPKNFLIGSKAKGWLLSEVNGWIQNQVSEYRKEAE